MKLSFCHSYSDSSNAVHFVSLYTVSKRAERMSEGLFFLMTGIKSDRYAAAVASYSIKSFLILILLYFVR